MCNMSRVPLRKSSDVVIPSRKPSPHPRHRSVLASKRLSRSDMGQIDRCSQIACSIDHDDG